MISVSKGEPSQKRSSSFYKHSLCFSGKNQNLKSLSKDRRMKISIKRKRFDFGCLKPDQSPPSDQYWLLSTWLSGSVILTEFIDLCTPTNHSGHAHSRPHNHPSFLSLSACMFACYWGKPRPPSVPAKVFCGRPSCLVGVVCSVC